MTTKIESDWKRLNTLAHYQVRNQNQVVLMVQEGVTQSGRICSSRFLIKPRTGPSRTEGVIRVETDPPDQAQFFISSSLPEQVLND